MNSFIKVIICTVLFMACVAACTLLESTKCINTDGTRGAVLDHDSGKTDAEVLNQEEQLPKFSRDCVYGGGFCKTWLVTDLETGCQYIEDAKGGITDRHYSDGIQVCGGAKFDTYREEHEAKDE